MFRESRIQSTFYMIPTLVRREELLTREYHQNRCGDHHHSWTLVWDEKGHMERSQRPLERLYGEKSS